MRALTSSEKRTVRYAAIGISVYLLLFFGWRAWASVHQRDTAYQQLVDQARDLRLQLQPYDDLVLTSKKMMDHYQLDPAKLSLATVVGQASEQIQNTAAACGLQVGPIRESPVKTSAREMATLQFEGSGPIPGVLGLLKRLETLGAPLIVDSVQLTPDSQRPGQLKLVMTVIVLNFDQWKTEGKSHA